MKTMGFLRATAMALTLSASVSCKTPIVDTLKPLSKEKPAAVQMPEPRKHPCASSVIKGGRQASCHVLFQLHASAVDHSLDRDSAISQVLIYHVLSDLIRNYGTDTVLLEGVRPIDDLQKMLSVVGKEQSRVFVERYESCKKKISAQIKKQRPDLSYRHAGADFCLAAAMLRGYLWSASHYLLLVFQNPSAKFTGLERRPDQLSKEIAQLRLMDKLSRNLDLLKDPKFVKKMEKNKTDENAPDRGIYAVQEALSSPSRNSAVVIGVGHKNPIKGFIRRIPFEKRPTFFFIEPECQANSEFFVSPEIINQALRQFGKKP